MLEKLASFGGDLLHLFIAPHRLAEDIDEKPRFIGPMIFLSILLVVYLSLIDVGVPIDLKTDVLFLLPPPTNTLLELVDTLNTWGFYGIEDFFRDDPFYCFPRFITYNVFSSTQVIFILGVIAIKYFLFGKLFKGIGKFESIFSAILYVEIAAKVLSILLRISVLLFDIRPFITLASLLPEGVPYIVYRLVDIDLIGIYYFLIIIIMIRIIHDYDTKYAIATTALIFLLNRIYIIWEYSNLPSLEKIMWLFY